MNMSANGSPPGVVIAAHGLRRSYGRGDTAFEAVRGVDLTVREGEVFALLGTNGAGKTSTFDLLEGLAAPSAGEVTVFGFHPRRDRARLRPHIGMMLQSGGLPADSRSRKPSPCGTERVPAQQLPAQSWLRSEWANARTCGSPRYRAARSGG